MANYPGSISNDSNLFIAVNGIQTTLAASILSTDTTIQLTSATGFPTTGYVTIDNGEVVLYTGISGANLTGCTRGADGTTAVAHSLGVTVGATIVAAHHNLLKNEIEAIETALGVNLANVFPATATTGTGNVVLQTSPTLITPNLGTPSAAVLTSATGLPLTTGVTGTLPNGNTTATPNATASTIVSRDANSNTKVNNLIENFSTTATAASTTVLTVSSSSTQQFTGTTTQTVTLPDATTLSIGFQFTVLNRSTGAVAVNNNGGSLQQSVAAATSAIFTVTNIGSANGVWDVNTPAGGITQLTGDVTAGSGTGSQAATVAFVGAQSAGVVATGVQNVLSMLDNGGFEIWQRGTSFSAPANAAYLADRWKVRANETTGVTVSQESSTVDSGTYSLKIAVASSGASKSWAIEQDIENYTDYRGKTVTVTMRAWANTANTIRVAIGDSNGSAASSYHTGNSTWQTLTTTYAVTSNATSLFVFAGMVSGDKAVSTSYLDSTNLMVGSTSLPFLPVNPQVDLARCQRFYQTTNSNGATGSASGTQRNTTTVDMRWSFITAMRTNPTITFSSPTIGIPGTSSGQTLSSPSINTANSYGAQIIGSISAQGAVGLSVFLDGGTLAGSADL